MFEAISSQGGVVNSMMGDGLMAVFGAPLHSPTTLRQPPGPRYEMMEMLEMLNADHTHVESACPSDRHRHRDG